MTVCTTGAQMHNSILACIMMAILRAFSTAESNGQIVRHRAGHDYVYPGGSS